MSGWLTQFLLGRPGNEYLFDINYNPEMLDISEMPLAVLQKNLAGDSKKSVIKASIPTIKISAKEMTPAQRNTFSSLARISDTFLSFQTRDDWQVTDELVTIIDATHVQIANTSATRLSKALVQLGKSSTIAIQTPFNYSAGGGAYGAGAYGAGAYGVGTFDPGAITYDDLTRIITMANPMDTTAALFVSYVYTGWLVDMKVMNAKGSGPFAGTFSYDIQLDGA